MAEQIVDQVLEAVENATSEETITNAKVPSTPEGIAVAYGSLVIMAMLPIVFGSIRSVKLHKAKKVRDAYGFLPQKIRVFLFVFSGISALIVFVVAEGEEYTS